MDTGQQTHSSQGNRLAPAAPLRTALVALELLLPRAAPPGGQFEEGSQQKDHGNDSKVSAVDEELREGNEEARHRRSDGQEDVVIGGAGPVAPAHLSEDVQAEAGRVHHHHLRSMTPAHTHVATVMSSM
ncbi:hypothetical protein EYF80_055092 [Liparis tanakae]|uniref:Uncharacterized protein n=1 Tax=Liparis tanakae TaxID=230148 RepID=A0A4Z2F0S4_9TELE|nr:hypothetical protein EYF80_055092 [Liparis tanakae]